jgi:hypothetical protein
VATLTARDHTTGGVESEDVGHVVDIVLDQVGRVGGEDDETGIGADGGRVGGAVGITALEGNGDPVGLAEHEVPIEDVGEAVPVADHEIRGVALEDHCRAVAVDAGNPGGAVGLETFEGEADALQFLGRYGCCGE